MNGIKGTAKERDAARMMFGGGAVRLRYGQCASQERVIRAGYDEKQYSHESLTGVGEESCLGAFSLFSAGVSGKSSEESWAERGILSKESAMERTRSFTPSPATAEME